MKSLSLIYSNIPPSKTVQLDSRAKNLVSQGVDIINLSSGEPLEQTSPAIKQAAIYAIEKGLTKYSDPTGVAELKKSVGQKLSLENGLTYANSQIVITSGAKHAIYNSLAALINPGDEVLIPSPYWVTYPTLVTLLGGKPVFIKGDVNDNYKIKPRDLEVLCTTKTKCIILNSPCNPTGAVYTQKELLALGEIIVKNDLYCISDEIYEHLIYTETKHISIASLSASLYERCIVVNGVSKAYAMTGYRIGFTAAPQSIAHVIAAFQSQSTHHPSMPAQYAAIEAFDHGQEFYISLRQTLLHKRKIVEQCLAQTKLLDWNTPQGAFYFLFSIKKLLQTSSQISTSDDFCEYLLNEFKVATVPGSAFGLETTFRISFTNGEEQLKKGIERILAGIKKLNS